MHTPMNKNPLDTQNLCSGQNLDSLLRADTVGNDGGVLVVVHQEELEFGKVVDEELLVAGGEHVTGLGVGSVTDLGHGGLALETTTNLLGVSRCDGDSPLLD
jgi:hypothetical protein